MASYFSTYCARVTLRATFLTHGRREHSYPFGKQASVPGDKGKSTERIQARDGKSPNIRVSDGGESYLDMWKNAVDRERRETEFQRMIESSAGSDGEDKIDSGEEERESPEALARKNSDFLKILDVSTEERDRVQRMQVIDRAAAAIAAARALLKENPFPEKEDSGDLGSLEIEGLETDVNLDIGNHERGGRNTSMASKSPTNGNGIIPGPDFWSWIPPPEDDNGDENTVMLAGNSSPYPSLTNPIMEKEQSLDFLSIPLESKLFERNQNPPLPPLQSLLEVEKSEVSSSILETPYLGEEQEIDIQFIGHAAEAALALDKVDDESSEGVHTDGSRWWRETGTEERPDGVVCRWTLTRGVSADKAVEWEDKYWEAADELGYKELGSEKSGRDAAGNVWHEFWKESMSQIGGHLHLEKAADKWGKNGKGDEWQEKWWEHYGSSGQSEKWAHKWCSTDPNTQLEAGHAHIWHERWGEKYDGQGGSVKYTDKWAERCEGDAWTKWGDKWDEHFDHNGHGVKQGETWWEGKYGERWNRTWGEGHNGTGWVHKYGKSSSGEHWDTHVEQDTWYERYPHYGLYHCFENSVQLREVKKPSDWA